MSSSGLPWPRVKVTQKMQKKRFSRWKHEAGSGRNGEKRERRATAAFDINGVFCVEGKSALVVRICVFV